MEQKIIKVYYDENGLPYQDLALTKPYSIVGSDFTGANNATEVHFYVANIDDTYTWVANIKLQDGTMTYRLLTSATDEESEPYKLLVLDNGITAKKGFIYVGLNGYGGETLIEEVEGVLTINGNPIIVATGTISIALNYNPVVIPLGTSIEPTEVQQILANLSQKLEQDDLDTALEDYLPLAGGTMSGAISQPVAPVVDDDLANKKYVDDEVAVVAEDIANILDGNLTVHTAYHAEMDVYGNVIPTTYATKIQSDAKYETIVNSNAKIKNIGSFMTIQEMILGAQEYGISKAMYAGSGDYDRPFIILKARQDAQVISNGIIRLYTNSGYPNDGPWVLNTSYATEKWATTQLTAKQSKSEKGQANGYASLDSSGKVPSTQLPAYVDDILEFANFASFPATGTSGIIYVALDTNLTYRWSGSGYTEISPSLALGETSATAYRGDKGKTAYDHSQLTTGNPHNVQADEIPFDKTVKNLLIATEIQEAVDELSSKQNDIMFSQNEPYYTTKLGSYVLHSTGGINYTGNYFQVMFMSKPKFKYIKVFVQNNDIGISAIAFYNSPILFNSTTFMASSSIQIPSSSSDGVYVIAKVPVGAEAVVVSSRNDNITPKVWVSEEYYSTNKEILSFLTSMATSGNSTTFPNSSLISSNNLIKIVVKTFNFSTPVEMNFQDNFVGFSSLRIDGVGSYYLFAKKEVKQIYVSNAQGNIDYDVYVLENPNYLFKNNSFQTNPILKTKIFDLDLENISLDRGVWANDFATNRVKRTPDATRASTDFIMFTNGTIRITFDCPNNNFSYAVSSVVFNDNISSLIRDTSWITSSNLEYLVEEGNCFIISFKKNDGSVFSIGDLLANITLTIDVSDCFNIPLNKYEIYEIENALKPLNKLENQLKQIPYYYKKEISHLFIDKIYASSNPIIPCQSVFAIEMEARLGFKVCEGNIHKTATAGKYIVMHGVGGKIGEQLVALDSSDITNVIIANTSFNDLRTLYVYRSQYDKYKVPVSSLEEWLYACKKHNIIPLLSRVDDTQMEIVRSIVGENFILDKISSREHSKGMAHCYSSSFTKTQAIEWCEKLGSPLGIYGDDFSAYTDEDLIDLVKTIHSYGCLIGIVGAYATVQEVQRCMGLGFDMDCTNYSVNEFESGNLSNLNGDLLFGDFTTNGTVTDGLLNLQIGEQIYITPLANQFLAKEQLKIRFSGTISISMGSYINSTSLTSDGVQEVILSTYIMEEQPSFTITATGETDIYSLNYKASKC